MPVQHNKLVIEGSFPGGEVWSCNFGFIASDGSAMDVYEDMAAWAQSAFAVLTSLATIPDLRSALTTAASMTAVSIQAYSNSGELIQSATSAGVPVPGNSLAVRTPRDCIVLSLETGRPGRSFRGRVFWPSLGTAVSSSTLRLPSATVLAFATQGSLLLRALALSAPAPYTMIPVIVSQTRGVNTPVTQVSVDDILDTQRRRTDAWVGVRQFKPYPAP